MAILKEPLKMIFTGSLCETTSRDTIRDTMKEVIYGGNYEKELERE
jgi:hypothetical protein